MLEALNASWTTSQNSMIPLEAERCFPKGPTAGPYRMIPRSENKPEEVLQPEKKEGALKRWLSRRYVFNTILRRR
jgi:hypothetical protein